MIINPMSIIFNIPDSCYISNLLIFSMSEAMRNYPSSNAVIVRRHGIYVWGDTWQDCKTM